jgi:hypothetical protein
LPVSMSSKAAFIVALFLSRHPPDDQISRLRLPLWTSTGKAEPIAVMLRQTKAGEIGALRALCSDLISDRDPTISTCARSIDLPGGTCATQFDQPPERRPSPGWGGHAPPTSISRTPQGLCQAGGKFGSAFTAHR